jgi:hypothetical protein
MVSYRQNNGKTRNTCKLRKNGRQREKKGERNTLRKRDRITKTENRGKYILKKQYMKKRVCERDRGTGAET